MVQSTDQTQEISVLIVYIQQLNTCAHTHHVCLKKYILKSRQIHQDFSAFEKPFNDPSRDID